MNYEDLTILGIAFGLGLLVGMQRERANNKLAGVRTFTLISILGVIAGFLARDFDNPFILPALGLSIAALLIGGNILGSKSEGTEFGQTTTVAALLMFAIGAYLVMGSPIVGVVVGGGMAILLYIKEPMHKFIQRLKDKDVAAIMIFAAISLIILPILPNETYGPLNVLNPHNIWLMVTLIVGISVVGYFIYKFMGKDSGLISNAILGGLISSTATTVSYSRKAKVTKTINKASAFVIIVASAISIIRVLIEVAVVVPEKFPQVMLPLLVLFFVIAILGVVTFYFLQKNDDEKEMPEPKNPAQLMTAIIFGVLYGLILLAVAFVKEGYGDQGLLFVTLVSGLISVDAITLSLSQIMKIGELDVDRGWRLIMMGVLANLVFKWAITAVLGHKKLLKWVTILFAISIGAGLLIIWLWP